MTRSLVALLLALTLAACGGPRNYNQCILENVKSGMSDEAVLAVREACVGEFSSEGAPPGDQGNIIGDGLIIEEPRMPETDNIEMVADSLETMGEF